jgi:hypothetical protein
MVSACPRRCTRRKQKLLLSRTSNTAKEYASNTTIHGFAYIANQEHPLAARALWLFVVLLAVVITTIQMTSLHNQWKTYPVITTLDTIAFPIENIEFPAVTICPQGSMKEIVDNVMFQQLRDYITNKKEHHRQRRSTSQDMMGFMKEFLRDVYPGANAGPAEFVSLLTSDNPHQLVKNKAVVLQNQNEECDDAANHKIFNKLNKQLNMDFCPDGFAKLDNTRCVMSLDSQMEYNEASSYCTDVGGATLLHLDSYGDIEELYLHSILGKYENTSMYKCIHSLK